MKPTIGRVGAKGWNKRLSIFLAPQNSPFFIVQENQMQKIFIFMITTIFLFIACGASESKLAKAIQKISTQCQGSRRD